MTTMFRGLRSLLARRGVGGAAVLVWLLACSGAPGEVARGMDTRARSDATDVVEPGGAPVDGRIDSEGARSSHVFLAREGQRLAISVTATGDETLDPFVRVYSPDGELIAEDDDGGDSLDSLATVIVRSGGRHIAEVAGYNDNSTGDYALAITLDRPPSRGNVVLDERRALEEPDGVTRLEFTAQEGDRALIAVNSDGGDFDPVVALLDPDGSELGSDDDSGSGRNSLLERQLPRTGTYTVEITEYGADTAGSFQVVVSLE